MSVNRFFYTQDLKYKNSDLYLTSDWFRSEGIKVGLDNKYEMLYKYDGPLRDSLKLLDAEALNQLKIPLEFVGTAYFSNETAYRSLPNSCFL